MLKLKVFIAMFYFLVSANCLGQECFAQDKIIVIVNSDAITQKDLDDFSNFMRLQLSREYQGEALEEKIGSMKSDLLDKLIEDRLILQEAKRNDYKIEAVPKKFISVKPDESRVRARLSEIQSRYRSDAEFQQDLLRQGLVQSDVEEKIREQLIMLTMVEVNIRDKIVVSPQEVTSFYAKNPKEFIAPEERELEVIALENKDLANTFLYNLKSGKGIADLAGRYPIALNKIRASRNGELRKDVEDTVFNLRAGEAAGPIKADDKYYIFNLLNIYPARQMTLQEVQDSINSYLFQIKMQEGLAKWLKELKDEAYIKVMRE